MDAVKFLKKYHKLCDPRSCDDCPLLKRVDGFKTCLAGERNGYEERVVEIVEKWSKEQENKMTRQEAIYQIKNLAVLSSEKDMASITEALEMAIEALEQEPCDDCISKTLALEILNAMANVDKDNIKVYSKVYSQIKDIPSVTQRCEKWIPVTERLPEIGDTVIISGKMKYKGDKDYEEFVDVAIFEVTQRFETFNDWYEGQDEFEIVAWQPLPEPYEETEQ